MVVLIIDGSEIVTERLIILITETGNRDIKSVYTAGSYDAAIELLREKAKPDVVLLDVNLPGNRSVDLFSAIKKTNSHVSFIILFNYADAVAKEQYEWLGADYIFDKYNDFEKIPLAIDTINRKKNTY